MQRLNSEFSLTYGKNNNFQKNMNSTPLLIKPIEAFRNIKENKEEQ